MAWDKSQGKYNKGLANRRKVEWKIYSKNIYNQLFLDKELNQAYKLLRTKLSKEKQLDLKKIPTKMVKVP